MNYFVTGTDTGVGKTVATLALITALRARGLTVFGMKPVASGASCRNGRLRNADAEQIRAAASRGPAYEEVNPWVFERPIAPCFAARAAGVVISTGPVEAAFRRLDGRADLVIVEGAGGWDLQLNERECMADLVDRLGLGVILVVGLRLGCLNHARLTAAALRAAAVPFSGWIANRIDPAYETLAESLAYLKARLDAPYLGLIPWAPGAAPATNAACLDLRGLAIGAEGQGPRPSRRHRRKP